MKRTSLAAALAGMIVITAVPERGLAEFQGGFLHASANYLDWTERTTTASGPSVNRPDEKNKEDFVFLELEGQARFSWGEFYGFYDLEEAFSQGDERRSSLKTTLRLYLPEESVLEGFNVYAHVFDFNEKGFSEQSRVYGFGYNWFHKDLGVFKPFIGVHDAIQTFFSGETGYMAGLVWFKSFEVREKQFTLTNWHEFEFDRDDLYAEGNGGSEGHNGALGLWWDNVTTIRDVPVSMGLQWRYANNKLGQDGDQHGVIYTVRVKAL